MHGKRKRAMQMARRYERENGFTWPDECTEPMLRPSRLSDPFGGMAWDMRDNWLTAAEWLAWCRRGKTIWKRWNGKKWIYPSRPQIEATLIRAHSRWNWARRANSAKGGKE
jgi:hypothetical protein